MEGHAQNAILENGLIGIRKLGGNDLRTIVRIDTENALADALGQPEVIVRSPDNFPGEIEFRCNHARRERRRVGDCGRPAG